jgi:plastocyanin
VNDDMFEHTATARDRRFDLDLKPGATGVSRIDRPGGFEVYCRYHPGMKLRIDASG